MQITFRQRVPGEPEIQRNALERLIHNPATKDQHTRHDLKQEEGKRKPRSTALTRDGIRTRRRIRLRYKRGVKTVSRTDCQCSDPSDSAIDLTAEPQFQRIKTTIHRSNRPQKKEIIPETSSARSGSPTKSLEFILL